MKFRQGFVSNSSTTSFCIYGINIEETDYTQDQEIEKKLQDTQLKIFTGQFDTYIGREWFDMADNETGAQFKQSVRNDLANLGYSDVPGTHKESYYDG